MLQRFRRPMLVGGFLALALGTTALTELARATDNQAGTPPAVALPRPAGPDFADVAARVAPAVVRVTTVERAQYRPTAEVPPQFRGTPMEELFRRFGGRGMPAPEQRRAGLGSGFIVDANGYIVTNAHVVGDAGEVQVRLADGRELKARVIGRDTPTDIALIKVDAANLPTVGFGDSDRVRVGEWVMAMGNPFGLGGTATAGIVSARGRQIGAGPYDDFIQTDAPINPGNSGGPLFSTGGEVIGMNTAIFSPSGGNVGIGFAVPSKMVQHVVAQLRETGRVERGWLGVSVQMIDPELSQAIQLPNDTQGALVAGVEPDSPAAKAGLQPGDVITAINGQPVRTPGQVASTVAEFQPGRSVTLSVLRDGRSREQAVELGNNPANRQIAKGGEESPQSTNLGITLAERREGGVVVAEVEPGGIAEERGLRPGDIILRAGDRTIAKPTDVREALRAARRAGRTAIALQIQREDGRAFVAIPLHGQG